MPMSPTTAKSKTTIVDDVEVLLSDTGNVDYSAATIAKFVENALLEVSQYVPYVYSSTKTSDGTKIISGSTLLPTLIYPYIERAEYPVSQDPPIYYNVAIEGTEIRIIINSAPTSGASVDLWCVAPHTLSDSASTLTAQLEQIVTMIAAARAAMSRAQSKIDIQTYGGPNVWQEVLAWGKSMLADAKDLLLSIPSRPNITYSQ